MDVFEIIKLYTIHKILSDQPLDASIMWCLLSKN